MKEAFLPFISFSFFLFVKLNCLQMCSKQGALCVSLYVFADRFAAFIAGEGCVSLTWHVAPFESRYDVASALWPSQHVSASQGTVFYLESF